MLRVVFILFFSFSTLGLTSQDLQFEHYTDRDGLPSNTTYIILQDTSGLLWIGTENGLVSYDGDEFTTYTHPDLNDNDIVEMIINDSGRVYFTNISRQIGYVDDQKMTIIKDERLYGKSSKQAFINGTHYVGIRDKGEYKICEFEHYLDDSIYLKETDIYLFEYDSGRYFSTHGDGYLKSSADGTIYKADPDHRMKYVSENSIHYLDQINFYTYLIEVDTFLNRYIEENPFEKMVKYKDDFFLLNNKGAAYYESKTNKIHTFLENNRINTLFIDSANNAWLSTPNNGLYRISNLILKLEQTNIINDGGVNTIHQDNNGNIYLGTQNGNVIINPFQEKKDIRASNFLRPIYFFETQEHVFAYDIRSICKINKSSFQFEKYGYYHYQQKRILHLDSFSLIGTAVGVKRVSLETYLNGSVEDLDVKLTRDRTTELFYQRGTGKVFVGTVKGLYVSKKDSFVVTQNNELSQLTISGIASGNDNSIWIGTQSKGVFQVRNDSILSRFNIKKGMSSDNINAIDAHENELLVSTRNGLNIINLQTHEIRILSEYNLLPSSEVLVCKVVNDEYWIGTERGLSVITKEEIGKIKEQNPNLTLKQLYVNGEEVEYVPKMDFAHSVNNIQLSLQNISFNSGKDKYVKYRIPKIDTSWVSTVESIIRLPALKPGKYRIEALGVSSIGTSSEPLYLDFRINRPWWETWWARFLGLLVLLFIGFLIIQFRIRQEKQKRDYLTQINDIKDQALQLQMNPHFIFNSLNAIQGFIGTDDEEMAMNYLARFARLIRLIFEHSKGNTISLEEELEFINLYLDLEKLRFKNKVEIEVMVDENVESMQDMISVPPLLIQPIVENSFKHGLFHKKGKGKLKIAFKLENQILNVKVEDNGIGREAAEKISKRNNEKHVSSGIKTTLERLALMNYGLDRPLNQMIIEDKYDKDGGAIGTHITLQLGLNNS